ncbi:phosphatidate cytidylyltransferase [Thalassiella azotivora]
MEPHVEDDPGEEWADDDQWADDEPTGEQWADDDEPTGEQWAAAEPTGEQWAAADDEPTGQQWADDESTDDAGDDEGASDDGRTWGDRRWDEGGLGEPYVPERFDFDAGRAEETRELRLEGLGAADEGPSTDGGDASEGDAYGVDAYEDAGASGVAAAHERDVAEEDRYDGPADGQVPVPLASEVPAPGRRARRAGSAGPGHGTRRSPGASAAGAPAAPASRAGRNLPAAVGVGVALGALVVASLFVRKEVFVAVVAVAAGLAVWELTQAFSARRITVPLVPALVGTLGVLVSGYASGEEAMLVAFALTSLAMILWRVIDGVDGAVRDVAAGIFTAAYVPFLAGFAMLMLAADDGPWRIVVFILVTISSDIGGYAVGVVAGRHPMAPSVSPKKSWEGLAGSAAACVLAGVLSVTLLLDGAWWAGALLGLATVATATVGDLSESLLKRDLGIKDMGSLLPGHGGMMDRLDSLLPTAPVAYLLLLVLVPGA